MEHFTHSPTIPLCKNRATWRPLQDADALDFASETMRADKEVVVEPRDFEDTKGRNKWLHPQSLT